MKEFIKRMEFILMIILTIMLGFVFCGGIIFWVDHFIKWVK